MFGVHRALSGMHLEVLESTSGTVTRHRVCSSLGSKRLAHSPSYRPSHQAVIITFPASVIGGEHSERSTLIGG